MGIRVVKKGYGESIIQGKKTCERGRINVLAIASKSKIEGIFETKIKCPLLLISKLW